jgi:nitroreductase
MELMDAIKKRRAIRKFKPDPVPETMMEQILEAARLAPSGVNAQPWKFKVVTDPAEKENLFQATKNQFHVGQAPAVIVVCADTMAYSKGLRERFRDLYEKGVVTREDLYSMGMAHLLTDDEEKDLSRYAPSATFNTAIATEHMALMAASLGLGSCWVHLFDKEEVAKLFSLPPWILPVTLLPVGFPDEDPEPRPRKSLEEITL